MSPEERIARLQESGASDIERRLLASVTDDEMPDETYRALLRWSSSAAVATATPAGKSWKLPLVKGIGLLALAAASMGVLEYRSSARREPAPAPANPSPSAAPALSANASELRAPSSVSQAIATAVSPNELPSAPVAAPAASITATSMTAPSITATSRGAAKAPATAALDLSLAEQMKFIDAARTALRGGEARRALTVLGTYDQRFPKRAFEEEATFLRVSALKAVGERAEAKRVGDAFLGTHPPSLYSRRIEAIVRALSEEHP